MTRKEPSAGLDDLDLRLLLDLSRDGRRAAAALAKDLGLSRQAVTERIHALEARGVIRGYRADVDPRALGLGVQAQIRLTLHGAAGPAKVRELLRRLGADPHVRMVHRVSGEDCFVAHVLCRRIEDVNALLAELQATRALQASRTSFVLEALLERTALGPLDPALLKDADDGAPEGAS